MEFAGMVELVKIATSALNLLAFMLFVVKGLPALMGGAQDANGNPLTISYSVTVDAAE